MVKLYQGDCFELIKGIPDKSIDMILCDLPYGKTQNENDKRLPLDVLWREYKRIIIHMDFVVKMALVFKLRLVSAQTVAGK